MATLGCGKRGPEWGARDKCQRGKATTDGVGTDEALLGMAPSKDSHP